MKKILLAAAFAAALAPLSRAASNDCVFDGNCAPRAPSRWDGVEKGAEEGATFGLLGTLTPAVHLVSEGFGRGMSRAADGPRGDNGGGGAYTFGGIVLAVLLYIPALVVGGVGGLIGGLIGGASPETVSSWDAERTLAGD